MCALRAADRFYRSHGLFKDTRDIHLAVTVSDRRRWRGLTQGFRQSVMRLSGDRLNFWPIAARVALVGACPSDESATSHAIREYSPDSVCLFSGGADSLCGVAHLLTMGRRPLLVSHAVGPISGRQQELFDALRRRYAQLHPCALIQLRAYPNAPGRSAGRGLLWSQRDDLQRLRSMFFFSLAAQIAAAYQLDEVFICENGLIAAAIAFSPNQYTPYTTRPAEPHYLRQVQELLRGALDHPSLCIRNPFQYMTKGEVLSQAATLGLRDIIYRTISCWRSGNRGVRNCGECVPCMFRQLAFHEADLGRRPGDYYGYPIPPVRWRGWRSTQRHRLIALHEYSSEVIAKGQSWLFANEPAVTDAIDVTAGPTDHPPTDAQAQAKLDELASARVAGTIERFARATLARLK
jgi:7-cyano-7-deazaguanine synthase in queuosine biosynthesis